MAEITGQKSREELKNETYDLIRRAQEGEETAKEAMIAKNTGLVKSAAAKFINMGCEWDDLMQIGFVGLTKAIKRFDFSYGLMFSTYAVPMIVGEIRRFLRDDGKIKVSRDIKTGIQKLRYNRESFFAQKGRAPKISELAEILGVSAEMILSLIEAEEACANFEYLDDPEGFERAEKNFRQTEDEEHKIDLLSMKEAIGGLEEKEQKLIALRYQKDMTQQQTAKILGISQVQVSRWEKKILRKLKLQIF